MNFTYGNDFNANDPYVVVTYMYVKHIIIMFVKVTIAYE